MIITKQKAYEAILASLEDYKKIFLVGCGDCATTCKAGGEEELAAMRGKLESSGKTVTGTVVPEATCVASKIKLSIGKNREAFKDSEAVLIFACGLAAASFKENDRFGLEIIPGCDTLFGSIIDAKGDFSERCSACGECIIDTTGGICPVTMCSKGILNGPCGGVKMGKCEVGSDRDCAWVLIYEDLKAKGKQDKFLKIAPPKDYSKSGKPRSLTLNKADK